MQLVPAQSHQLPHIRHVAARMAHAARISALADSLVQRVLGVDAGDRVIAQTRPAVARGLRDNSHGRTNQFDVKARLDGLIEKFTVLDRDDLSEALRSRLEALPGNGKWLPEILALILALSDRPVEKTRTDALASLYHEESPGQQLTWEAIIADDPLNEPGVWDDIEHGYHSSGDETGFSDDLDSEPTVSSQATTIDEHNSEAIARSYVSAPDVSVLDRIKCSQVPHGRSALEDFKNLSDLLAIRESLFMLRGCATTLYGNEPVSGKFQPKPSAETVTSCQKTFQDVLAQFADLGNALQLVRTWISQEDSRPYTQTCKAAVERLLRTLETDLSNIEKKYVGAVQKKPVSLTGVLAEAEILARPLSEVATIIGNLPTTSPFAILDALYEKSCVSQLSGDDHDFEVFSSILFEGTQTYLRPVGRWISTGAVILEDHDMFVRQSESSCPLGNVWHSSHTLLLSRAGLPSSPVFLQDKTAEIFALGKTKMFLDRLSPPSSASDSTESVTIRPDFALLRSQLGSSHLSPFPQLFDDALQSWISTVGTDLTSKLQRCLIEQHGLIDMLKALECTFLAASGDLFLDFATTLFLRMRHSPLSWANDFLLTELAKETLGAGASVDPAALSITTDVRKSDEESSSISEMLQSVHISYRIPAALQNITCEATSKTHHEALVLILQITYAQQTLSALQINSITKHNSLLLRLRQALVVFLQVLRSHITSTVSAITPTLRASMTDAQTVDEMVAAYASNMSQLSTALLLSSNLRPIRDSVRFVLVQCERFASIWVQAALKPESQPHTGKRDSVSVDEAIALRGIRTDFSSSLHFIAAGVRSVSRASGSTLLESLAQQLEWMISSG